MDDRRCDLAHAGRGAR